MTAGKPAEHLAQTAPGWFEIAAIELPWIIGKATLPTAAWPEGLALKILAERAPRIQEQVPGFKLPKRCPERHIQGDHTFCLGYPAPIVESDATAVQWWSRLAQYLACQSTAEETSVWPPHHALDHGDAAPYHERALALAAKLGLDDEYDAAHANEASWLTSTGLRRFGWRGDRRGGGASSVSRPRLRFRRRQQVMLLDLMITERKRAKALAEYWRWQTSVGLRCCGTMRECPLKR